MKPRVHSWDLYDTLIAKRNDNEEDVFPIAELQAQVKPEDVIVTDMRLPESRLRKLSGLQNKMFVSDFGKGNGTMFPKVLAEYDLIDHTGDNLISDIQRARQAGITPRWVNPVRTTEIEKELLPKFPGLSKTIREARLRTWDANPLLRNLQLLQIQTNFPMLFLASILIDRKIGHQRLLMSARDCFMWIEAQKRVKQMRLSTYEIEYFRTSRLARSKPTPDYLEYVKKQLPAVIVDLAGTGWSLSHLLDRIDAKAAIFFLVKYDDRWTRNLYTDIKSVPIRPIHSIVRAGSSNVERLNLAPHEMFRTHEIQTNPTKINWSRDEILAPYVAFISAVAWTRNYDFSTDFSATDQDITSMVQRIYDRIPQVDDAANWSNELLRAEDKAVMDLLK